MSTQTKSSMSALLRLSCGPVQHGHNTWSVLTLTARPATRSVLALVIDRSDSLTDLSELSAVTRSMLAATRRAWFNLRHPVWVYRLSDPIPLDGPARVVRLDLSFDDDAGRRLIDDWIGYAALPSDRAVGSVWPAGRSGSLLRPVIEAIERRRDETAAGVSVQVVVLTDGRLLDAAPLRLPPNVTVAGLYCGPRLRSTPLAWTRALGTSAFCASPADSAISASLAAAAQPFAGSCVLRYDRRKAPKLWQIDAAGPREIDSGDIAVTLDPPEVPLAWALAWQDFSGPADWDMVCRSEFSGQELRLADLSAQSLDATAALQLQAWLTPKPKVASDPGAGLTMGVVLMAGSAVFDRMLDALTRLATDPRRGQTLASVVHDWRAGEKLLPRMNAGDAAMFCWPASGPVTRINVHFLSRLRAPFEFNAPDAPRACITVSKDFWAATAPSGAFVSLTSQPQVLLPFVIDEDGVPCRAAFVELKG